MKAIDFFELQEEIILSHSIVLQNSEPFS